MLPLRQPTHRKAIPNWHITIGMRGKRRSTDRYSTSPAYSALPWRDSSSKTSTTKARNNHTIKLAIGKPKIQKKIVFCFFDHTTTNTHNLMTFRFLLVVEAFSSTTHRPQRNDCKKTAYDASESSYCFPFVLR